MVFAKEVGADRVELYTEPYAANHGSEQGAAVLAQFVADYLLQSRQIPLF